MQDLILDIIISEIRSPRSPMAPFLGSTRDSQEPLGGPWALGLPRVPRDLILENINRTKASNAGFQPAEASQSEGLQGREGGPEGKV